MPLAGLENTTGSKIFVAAGEPAAYTDSGFKAMTYSEVVGTTRFGEWGNTNADVSEGLLSENQVIHTNGTGDGGEVPIAVQHRTVDAGAAILLEKAGTNDLVTIRKVYPSGDSEMAVGIISGARFREASGDSVRGFTVNARINTKVRTATAAAWAAAA